MMKKLILGAHLGAHVDRAGLAVGRKVRLSAIVVTLVGLSGCATNPLEVLDSAIFEVKCAGADDKEACIEQSRIEADAAQRRSAARAKAAGVSSGDDCTWHNYSTSGRTNVDVAYARARSRHGWRTYNERTKNGNDEWIDTNFIHTASPGAMYNMRDYAYFQSSKGSLHIWARLTLTRTNTGTDLSAALCLDPDETAYVATLDKQLRAIVK